MFLGLLICWHEQIGFVAWNVRVMVFRDERLPWSSHCASPPCLQCSYLFSNSTQPSCRFAHPTQSRTEWTNLPPLSSVLLCWLVHLDVLPPTSAGKKGWDVSSQKRTLGQDGDVLRRAVSSTSVVRVFLMIKQTHKAYALISGVSFFQWIECLGGGPSFLPPLLTCLLSRGPASLLRQSLIFFALRIRVITLPYLTCGKKTLEKSEALGSSGSSGLQRITQYTWEGWKVVVVQETTVVAFLDPVIQNLQSFSPCEYFFYLPCGQPTSQTVPLWNRWFSKMGFDNLI